MTTNMCRVKMSAVRMSKQKRKERKYLFLTVQFISCIKSYTIQYVFKWPDYTAVHRIKYCQKVSVYYTKFRTSLYYVPPCRDTNITVDLCSGGLVLETLDIYLAILHSSCAINFRELYAKFSHRCVVSTLTNFNFTTISPQMK